jgi:hypothetical protein
MKYLGIGIFLLAATELFSTPKPSPQLPMPGCGPHIPCPPPCGCGYDIPTLKEIKDVR